MDVGVYRPILRRWQNAQERMIQRPIPATGENLPVLGLGTWETFDVANGAALEPLGRVLRTLASAGGKLVDSSPMYGRSEGVLGELTERSELQGKLFLATKVWTSGQEKGEQQMLQSYERLRVRTMDLLQVHNLVDAETHLRTLTAWKQEGRVRYIGITHYQASAYGALERLIRRGGIDFVQFNYSLATRAAEQRMLPVAAEHNVAVLINRPFENGEMFERVRGKQLPAWAPEIDCATWSQIFLKYIVSHPAVTCVIPATANPRHMTENLQAALGRFPDEELRKRMVQDWERF